MQKIIIIEKSALLAAVMMRSETAMVIPPITVTTLIPITLTCVGYNYIK